MKQKHLFIFISSVLFFGTTTFGMDEKSYDFKRTNDPKYRSQNGLRLYRLEEQQRKRNKFEQQKSEEQRYQKQQRKLEDRQNKLEYLRDEQQRKEKELREREELKYQKRIAELKRNDRHLQRLVNHKKENENQYPFDPATFKVTELKGLQAGQPFPGKLLNIKESSVDEADTYLVRLLKVMHKRTFKIPILTAFVTTNGQPKVVYPYFGAKFNKKLFYVNSDNTWNKKEGFIDPTTQTKIKDILYYLAYKKTNKPVSENNQSYLEKTTDNESDSGSDTSDVDMMNLDFDPVDIDFDDLDNIDDVNNFNSEDISNQLRFRRIGKLENLKSDDNKFKIIKYFTNAQIKKPTLSNVYELGCLFKKLENFLFNISNSTKYATQCFKKATTVEVECKDDEQNLTNSIRYLVNHYQSKIEKTTNTDKKLGYIDKSLEYIDKDEDNFTNERKKLLNKQKKLKGEGFEFLKDYV